MVAPYNPPVKGEDLVMYIGLPDAADPSSFRANPTIAAGDFKVKKDGGAATNLTTLPTVENGVCVKLVISAAEMTADVVIIIGIDQTTPKEWSDFMLSIPTTA